MELISHAFSTEQLMMSRTEPPIGNASDQGGLTMKLQGIDKETTDHPKVLSRKAAQNIATDQGLRYAKCVHHETIDIQTHKYTQHPKDLSRKAARSIATAQGLSCKLP